MARRTDTITPEYFEELYRNDPDPWRFQTSAYERAKYQATLKALSRPRYRRALETGCSIGVFTKILAKRCDHLLAIDSSESALLAAQTDCARSPNVMFDRKVLPDQFPRGPFVLIVLSEVLYYFTAQDVRRIADHCLGALATGGELILCHWLGLTDYPLTGGEATRLFTKAVAQRLPVRRVLHDEPYRLVRLSGA